AVYLIDKQGQIVYRHFGEGNYAETEAEIQRLLAQPG
ncbi:MAG: TlpA family protein disulfide reductase, partial [Achromobacter sp.]